MADRITERALAVFRECYPATDKAAEWDESALRERASFMMGFCAALTSDPWLPIAECGELETGGEYLVRMKRGVLEEHITVARWSGAAWQVRIVDAERYYYRAEHITHVHRMGPIRGPGEEQ